MLASFNSCSKAPGSEDENKPADSGDPTTEEPETKPAEDAKEGTFCIGDDEFDIVKVQCNKINPDEEYRYFKITAAPQGDPEITPTVMFKFSETQFGKAVNISKVESLIHFVYANVPTDIESSSDTEYFRYDNLHNHYTSKKQKAEGSLKVTKLTDDGFAILFNAVIDDVEYKCNYSGNIDAVYFD